MGKNVGHKLTLCNVFEENLFAAKVILSSRAVLQSDISKSQICYIKNIPPLPTYLQKKCFKVGRGNEFIIVLATLPCVVPSSLAFGFFACFQSQRNPQSTPLPPHFCPSNLREKGVRDAIRQSPIFGIWSDHRRPTDRTQLQPTDPSHKSPLPPPSPSILCGERPECTCTYIL